MDIDLVYLWVDGNDPVWLAKKRAFTGEFVEGSETDGKGRYENNDELRYSLRSVEKFAPWIRRIFIVTDGQVPSWLDTSNPKIRIVDHREIMPPEVLPCFNASVIEYFLYRIPGLAEHFLFANDDTFFGAPVTPGFFFTADGYPRVMLRRKPFGKLRYIYKRWQGKDIGQYRRMLLSSAQAVKRATGKLYWGAPHHNIDAYLKSDYRYMVEEVFKSEIERSQYNRTRKEGDFNRYAFLLYVVATGHARLKYVGRKKSALIHVQTPDFMTRYLKHRRPMLFCLNDNQKATDKDRMRIKPFLETLFPDKSAFEK